MAGKKTARDDELSKRPAIRDRLLDIFADVERGYQDQRRRSDDILDYWDIYNCVLGERQFYNGNSQIFVPIVRNAIEARKTRFINQMFPQNGRNVTAVTSDNDPPYHILSLIENYVERTKLRTEIMPALMVSGDVEGQYTLYVDWQETERHVVSRVTKGVMIDGLEHPELAEIEKIESETITDAKPGVEVISDPDFLVLPATVDSLDQALENGGSVTVLRRWSKAEIKRKIADGDFTKAAGDALLGSLNKTKTGDKTDIRKELATTAGIKTGGSGKYAQGFETWTKLKVDGEMRICRAYYAGSEIILGCKLNPYWCDRIPVLSAPVKKIPGVFKGLSMIQPGVMDLQIEANDAINQGADNLNYALNPVTLVDPEQVQRWESLVLDLAAVWPVKPDGAKVLEFPNVSEKALATVAACKNEIFQALGVNPSMMPNATGGKSKRNQAEIANEQSVDLLSTADSVTVVEGGILTPMVQRFAEYDHQFRDEEVMVRSYGDMGLKSQMEEIEPIQMDKKWWLRWFGVEAARNAAQVQQQIAMLNVFKGVPPQMYPGYKLNAAPLMVQMAEAAFGPRLAPMIFQSVKDQLSIDTETENQMLDRGFMVPVHDADDDQQHLQAHMVGAGSDPHNVIRAHIVAHQQQMQQKQAAAAQQSQGLPGAPGGAGPGVAGAPKPGAQPQPQRPLRGPPGMINPDRMARAGAVALPRKT